MCSRLKPGQDFIPGPALLCHLPGLVHHVTVGAAQCPAVKDHDIIPVFRHLPGALGTLIGAGKAVCHGYIQDGAALVLLVGIQHIPNGRLG